LASLGAINTGNANALTSDVDIIPDSMNLQGIRANMSEDKEEALVDFKSQNVEISDSRFTHKVDEYLCSVLSSVIRLPPFSFVPQQGYSYLELRSDKKNEDSIMHLSDKNIWIVPLEDKRI